MSIPTPEQIGQNPTEFSQQCALFAWVAQSRNEIPALELMFAIKNEEKSGSAITGARFKAAGVRAGVPDVFLAYPCGQYAGLFVEMKKQGGKVSDEQKKWHKNLLNQRYQVSVCYSWQEARDAIMEYLNG